MTLLHAFILGIVQGLTEFIPVSSTAHLLIVSNMLGIPSGDKSFAFSVIIQLGTVFALLIFFWKDFWQITEAFFLGIKNKKPFENLHARMGWLVIIATLPALITGFFLKDIVQSRFGDPFTQAGIRLLVTAVLLIIVEYFDNRKRNLETATWLDALSVGLFQVLAIFPGASRSGSTIAGGMVRGFDRPSAARFAFLMSAPILLAAGAYESINVIAMPGTHAFLPYLITGFVTAAVVGWLSIKWLLAYISKHSLYIFAVYCAVVGIIIFNSQIVLMKQYFFFLISSFVLFSCTPATQTASQTEVVTVYATSAAQPWLTELYDCAEKLPVVLNVNADEPDIYLQLGEPENIVFPVYQIDEEEIWVVTHRESPILNMSLDELQSLFAGQGEPSIQVWVYSSGTDVQKVFDQFVMKGRSVTSLAHLAANPQSMLNVLEAERQAIGILPVTWSMKMNGSRGIYHIATVPVLAITQNEPRGVVIDLISCLQSN